MTIDGVTLRPGESWYFAYGSNMLPAIFCERRGMCPRAAVPALLEDHRLCFDLPIGPGERGVANLVAEPGAHTWGVLYLLTADELARLDLTEGVGFGVYARVAVDVTTAAGVRVRADTYRSARTCLGRKPSARYLGLLVDGARHHGLPADYVAMLECFELAIDEREQTAVAGAARQVS